MPRALASVLNFCDKAGAVLEVDLRKLRRDPTELLSRAFQPVLWLLVFGQVIGRIRVIPTGGLPYLDYMAPGVLAQCVLFISIFHGISVIWERDLGIMQKFLASPAPRAALVLGKALSAAARCLMPATAIYGLAWLLRVGLNGSPAALLGVFAVIVLTAVVFTTLSIIVSCIVKGRDRLMGVGQLMTMPLFFASNAIYPIAFMPRWLQLLSTLNPLTYAVDALRGLMLAQGAGTYPLWMSFGVLAGLAAALVYAGGLLYPRLAR
jgi:ABC-2 type transport system permease protein